MQVTMGRIVRFVLAMEGDKPVSRAAIVTSVWKPSEAGLASDTVNLHVFLDGAGDDFNWNGLASLVRPGNNARGVKFSEKPATGTWHWPPRET